MTPVMKEAKRLYDLGFAILWIKPKSKAPVKSKWTQGPRDSWDYLKGTYKPGFNVGVRLGTPSKIGDKYLAVIDIDVKSTEKRHQIEAEKAVKELFPSLPESIAQVMSGRGNGSSHLYIVTAEPTPPQKRKVSLDKIKALMPSAAVNNAQREALSEEDLNEGYRIRPAWEIAVMGEGQQVVLPPSTHPDSLKEYAWKTRVESIKDLYQLDLGRKQKTSTSDRTTTEDFKAVPVDLISSQLSSEIVELVLHAECDDRSAALFKCSIAMIKEGFTDHEIMSVLTDKNNELGKASYDHAKTDSRARAANWIYNYTLKKARHETDARLQFNEEVEVSLLSDEEAEKQILELQTPHDWRNLIERNGPKGVNANTPKPTLKNLILILTNEVAPDVFRRDVFAYRDFYGHSTPWGGVKGALISDEDAIKIKVWLGKRFRFEPKKESVFEVMTYLAELNSFDPVKDKLDALVEWDNVNRLDTWLKDHFEAEGEPEYLSQVFTKWMVAMVMRVYKPGAKFDWMPIFEGAQGIGKSSFGRLLVGDKYFLDWLPNLSDKDSALSLQGAWSVELGELSILKRSDVEAAKAFITRTIDKVRPPYGRKWIESPRRCVFFGTTNSDTYLRDDSGNRRFKPVKVGQLDFEVFERERDQLFAEALFIYRNEIETERTLELEGKAKVFELEIQSEKMILDESDLMHESILEFMEKQKKNPTENPFDFTKFKIKDLFNDFGPLGDRKGDIRDTMFAGKALRALGGVKMKMHGLIYWKLETRQGIPRGTPLNDRYPLKNFNEISN
jgi:predicted P-loop ATPase